jgi:hypothetical protein
MHQLSVLEINSVQISIRRVAFIFGFFLSMASFTAANGDRKMPEWPAAGSVDTILSEPSLSFKLNWV